MKIRKLLPVALKGFPNFNVGDVADVPPGEAMVLIGMGAAERVGDVPAADGFTTGRGQVEVREPQVETRDPQVEPVKRKTKA